MPRFEAGDHIGKAAIRIQISGQLLQAASGLLPIVGNVPIRSRSRRGGRFHVQRNCTARSIGENVNPSASSNLSY